MHSIFTGTRSRWLAFAVATLAAFAALSTYSQTHAEGSHQVQPGETLSGIAMHYGFTVQELADHNGISDPNFIVAGTSLSIPSGSAEHVAAREAAFHVVAQGDTLSGIAAWFGLSLDSLIGANSLANPHYIFPGQVIALPGGGTGGAYYAPYDAETVIRAAAAEWGVPSNLLLALAWQESGWQQEVTSWAGAVGLMQVMPLSADWVMTYLMGEQVDWQYDAAANARVGAAYLAHLLMLSGGDQGVALASYYQGWYSVQTNGFYDETHGYVNNVLYFANNVFN